MINKALILVDFENEWLDKNSDYYKVFTACHSRECENPGINSVYFAIDKNYLFSVSKLIKSTFFLLWIPVFTGMTNQEAV